MEKHQTQKFRQRGFLPANFNEGGEIVIIYNDEAVPLNPDQSEMRKIWDNDVEQHMVVRPHVEVSAPEAVPEAPPV